MCSRCFVAPFQTESLAVASIDSPTDSAKFSAKRESSLHPENGHRLAANVRKPVKFPSPKSTSAVTAFTRTYAGDRLPRMPKKKPKKKTDKKKSVRRKKAERRKKPIQRDKSTRSKVPSGSSSAQMHQAVGPQTASQSEIAPEISDDSGEFGGES